MTKEKFAGKMRYFWTTHWRYQTIDAWLESTKAKADLESEEPTLWGNGSWKQGVNNDCELINQAINKLVLEKLLKKDQAKRIREMLKSPDEENHYLAISIMASVKPKKFKQVITQNPETNGKDS